jgi:hypothetical protein
MCTGVTEEGKAAARWLSSGQKRVRDSTGKGKQKAEMGGHKTQTHTVSLSF